MHCADWGPAVLWWPPGHHKTWTGGTEFITPKMHPLLWSRHSTNIDVYTTFTGKQSLRTCWAILSFILQRSPSTTKSETKWVFWCLALLLHFLGSSNPHEHYLPALTFSWMPKRHTAIKIKSESAPGITDCLFKCTGIISCQQEVHKSLKRQI